MFYKLILFLFVLTFLSSGCSTYRNASVDVTHFGAVAGDGISDNEAFLRAFKKGKKVLIPVGVYNVGNLVVPEGVSLIGSGQNTILKKTKSIAGPILQLEGNNIKIRDILFMGNLFEEEGEWNHAINIRPLYKIYKNFKLENIKAIKMHGDGICIGAYQGNVENVKIKNFETDSCYRNGISITVGKNIKVENAKLRNSGMFGIDLEIDNGSKDRIENVVLKDITTCKLAIVGEGNNIIKKVKIEKIIIDQKLYANLYPVPGQPPFHPESLLLRSCRFVNFKNVTFKNSLYSLVKITDGADDINTNNITFKNLFTENLQCSDDTNLFIVPVHMTGLKKAFEIKPKEKGIIEH